MPKFIDSAHRPHYEALGEERTFALPRTTGCSLMSGLPVRASEPTGRAECPAESLVSFESLMGYARFKIPNFRAITH